ncbi:MAG: AAA family ATPase [Candidatus Dormibacteria bacterium]
MALIITVAMLKGGVGKTTTAVALAEAATIAGPVTLVDTDPMGSAVRWSVLAQESGKPLRAAVIGLPSPKLSQRLAALTQGSAACVIDSPPPGARAIAEAAIEVARIVVLPVPARMGDLDRVPATLELARQGGRQVFAVVTMARHTTSEGAARSALTSWGVEVLETVLPLRVAVAHNYGKRPSGMLAQFGQKLLAEITEKAT